jgi:hypothetical protein
MTSARIQTDLLQPYVLLHLMNALFTKGDGKGVIRRIRAPKGGIDPATLMVS